MSGLITKATKKRSSASQKMRATKGKKAAPRKPQRPGRITAAPKAKKAQVAKKLLPAKKSKQVAAAGKLAGRATKKVLPKKKNVSVSPAKKNKATVAKRSSRTKVAKSHVRKAAPKTSRKALLARTRALVPKPLPAPPKKPPSPGTLAAVRAFEQALRQFNRQDFTGAKSAFEGLLTKFADQAEIGARARTYLAICEQRLGRAPAVPRNVDALYNQGVFELNNGNTPDAVELFEKALKVEPRADHVYYSIAAAYARLNNTSKALDALRRAIGIRQIHRSHARRDLDFASLRSNEDFQHLTGFGFDLIDE